MIPVHLRLQGFLSYLHPAELDFTQFSVACISGPNGAGKSTLLDAITWALFGQARRRDDAVIHTAADAAQVTFVFDLGSQRYRVQRAKARGKGQALELHQWDPERQTWRAHSERRLRDTQAKIEALLGLDYRTFVQASFFLQGQADNFARQTPAERKETLARVLGLDLWEVFHERARERRRQAEAELHRLDDDAAEARRILEQETPLQAEQARLQQELQRLAAQRSQVEEALRTAEALRAQLDAARRRVDAARRDVAQAEAEHARAQRQYEAVQAELQALADLLARAEEIRSAEQRRRARQQEWQALERLARRYGELQAEYARVEAAYREARARLEQEQASLRQARRDAQAARERLRQLEEALAATQAQLDALPEADPDALAARQQELAATIARLQAENDELRAAMHERKERLERLRQASGATCPLCGQPLTDAHRAELLAQLEAEGKAMAERYRANQARLAELEAERQRLAREQAQARRAHATRQRLERTLAAQQAQADELRSLWHAWEAQGAPRLEAIAQTLAQESFAPDLRQRLDEIRAAQEALGYDPQRHAQLEAELKALAAAEAEAQRLAQAEAQQRALQARLHDWDAHRQQARARLQQAQADLHAAQEEFERLQAALPDLEALQRQWHQLAAQERHAQQALGAVQQQLAFVAETRERLATLEARRAAWAQRIAHYREVELACSKKGVPALLIEQALPHLEAEANEVLARLTDGEMHLAFRTQAAYKDPKRKDVRETLDIIVSDAHGERPYETFSGGEAFRINFAIRLALARVLAQRAGTPLRLLVIDEGFGSQDETGRQRLVEAINRVRSQFSHILVITHIPDLRDRFPVRIEVEKTPAGSRLHVVGV